MAFEEIADELYRLPRSAFTATRDARAADAARAGDRTLAAAIKKLRKPTTGAWLANLLAHERPDEVARLIELGADLRSAQGRLAGDDLRRLSQRRQELVAALAAEASRLARQAGQAAGESVVGELQGTLEAALADEDAAEALRSGRLTTGVRRAGIGPAPGAAAAPASGRLREAKSAAVEARRQVAQRRAIRERAEREVDRLAQRVGELEAELRSVRAGADQARKALREAKAHEGRAQRSEARTEGQLRRLER